ncbi:MAG: ATP-binding cassette domain-containing protein [Planctomycetota bacterium]|jgi:ABC-2 type transport system ATP-binding protein|nr:MAG: ATP-binding cassette domain-containing protein [Planctomycetota bacterium]
MSDSLAVSVAGLHHAYSERKALDGIDFGVLAGEAFGLLGPNGGGKTTLFRLLSTLLPVQTGKVTLSGLDVATKAQDVRQIIGVTFQSPSLDGKLTVWENLQHQAHLYGLYGVQSKTRIRELMDRLGLSDRGKDLAGSLSGGLKRRVEVAKSLLHHPQILLLDEPSTGLDPGGRRDLWEYLTRLRQDEGTTILVTTHLMEEAERCDRLGILNQGRMIALGTPDELRSSVGGDCLTIQTPNPEGLAELIAVRFQLRPQRIGESLRIEKSLGHELLRDIVAAFPGEITAISLARPTLEDVFIARTGHRFWEAEQP